MKILSRLGSSATAFLGLALMAGCAATPRAATTMGAQVAQQQQLIASEAPLSYPPSARQRIIRIALAEWDDWGRVTHTAGDQAESTHAEATPSNFPRVLAYWQAVPDDEGAINRNRDLYSAALAGSPDGARLFGSPAWSAAFVSYVMRSAGIGMREFPPSASHSAYIDALIQDAMSYPDQAPFIPHSPTEYAPQPGDLICADRSRNRLTDWRQRLNETGEFRPMHCDIAVAVQPGEVQAVGGNVLDSVTLTRYPTDASGLLLPVPLPSPTVFVVFEDRLGKLPPWNTGNVISEAEPALRPGASPLRVAMNQTGTASP